ncbi:MAG: N-acetylmuramoyl-L-alanine amidase [Saprospiraceae bacterium]
MSFPRILLLFLLLPLLSPLSGQAGPVAPQKYVNVPAQSGDNVPKLLQRYGLYEFDCNISQFFKINGLREDYRLRPGTAYKLPVLLMKYNGKSIRSSVNIKDWQTAKRIEAYNTFALNQGLRADDFRSTKLLWVPWHELHCANGGEATVAVVDNAKRSLEENMEENVAGKGKRIFPIFGKAYENTPLLDRKLKGKVFYIVSGHGGPDSGAQGKRGGHTLCEDEYAYDVALRLLRLLISHGATAYMIVRDVNDGIRDEECLHCDQDETVWGDRKIPRPQKERLQQRTDLINNLTERNAKAGITDQTLIEIHVDSRSHDAKTDVFFYYRPDSQISQQLALRFHKMFTQKYLRTRGQGGYHGTVTSRSLFMLNQTVTPKAVYIELANIRNDWDQQRLVLKNNRQAVANWLSQVLLSN